jgi:hypothetical protein
MFNTAIESFEVPGIAVAIGKKGRGDFSYYFHDPNFSRNK